MIAVVGACLLLAAAPKTTYQLDWKPTKGEHHQYRIKVHFDYDGTPLDFQSDLFVDVLGVASDGSYRLSTRTQNAVASSGDETHKLPDEPPTTQRFDRRGVPFAVAGAGKDKDPFSDLLDHLTEFQSPGKAVGIGESWLNAKSGPPTSWFGQPRVTYRLAQVTNQEKAVFARVSYVAAVDFDNYAATGSLTLAMPTNHLVHMDVVIPHFKPENAGEEARVQVVVQEQ